MKENIQRILAALLSIFLLTYPVGLAEYVGSMPEEGVYVVQSQKHTCTLIAATMMLRNYASRCDNLYEQVTESAVRQYAWNNL